MKKKQILLIFLMLVGLNLSANKKINVHQTGQIPPHIEHSIPADQPDVYYDSDLEVIIIDGGGEVGYYDVVIESATNFVTVISTQVSGYYDTIDVSSLTADEYIITISSPTGNDFEGFFEIE